MADRFMGPHLKKQKLSRGELLVSMAKDASQAQAKSAQKNFAAAHHRTPQPPASALPRRPPVTPITPAMEMPAVERAPAVSPPRVFALPADDEPAVVEPPVAPQPPVSRRTPSYPLTSFLWAPAAQQAHTDSLPPPQSLSEAPRYRHPGLVNLGHTCYLNSVLQVLHSLPGFRADVDRAAERYQDKLPVGSVVIALHRCFTALAARPSIPLRSQPQEVHTALWRAPDGAKFRSLLTQHDAHEVLLHALDRVAAEVAACQAEPADSAWCPTRRSFNAITRARLLCSGCQAVADVPESMRALSLELPAGDEPVDAMQLLTHALAAEAGVERRCELCGHNIASLSRSLATLPQVLVLHVKRFTVTSTPDGALLRKVLRPVHATPLLDVAPLCAERVRAPLPDAAPPPCFSDGDASFDSDLGAGRENAATRYRLHAVVHHIGGSLAVGHYTVDIRDEDSAAGGWLRFNDEWVSNISQGQALAMQREAYMLIFMHIEEGRPTAPSPADGVLRERNN